MTARPLLLLPLLLAAATPDDEPPLADDGALPQLVADQCTVIPNSSGLVHMRCGTERLIVAQLQPVGAPMHDELLESLLDLVPGPTARLDTSPGDDLVRTEIVQQRLDLDPRETSVVLVLTSRVSTGLSVGCAFGTNGRYRHDRRERAWCEQAALALLPPPPEPASTTHIEVEAPDHSMDDLSAP